MDEKTRRSFAEEGNLEAQRNNQFVGAAMAVLVIMLIVGFGYASYFGWF